MAANPVRLANILGLLAGAVIAPPVSVLIYTAASAVVEINAVSGDAAGDYAAGLGVTMLMATFLGLPSALLFGAIGAVLMERMAPRAPYWAWALAGAGTAATYCSVSIGLAFLKVDFASLLAQWVSMVILAGDGIQMPLVVGSIVLSGLAAGLVYRRLSQKG